MVPPQKWVCVSTQSGETLKPGRGRRYTKGAAVSKRHECRRRAGGHQQVPADAGWAGGARRPQPRAWFARGFATSEHIHVHAFRRSKTGRAFGREEHNGLGWQPAEARRVSVFWGARP